MLPNRLTNDLFISEQWVGPHQWRCFGMDSLCSGNLVAAGGSGGLSHLFAPAVFADEKHPVGSPLLSFTAHDRWISAVKFVGDNHLLTASDDSLICLWRHQRLLCDHSPLPEAQLSCHSAGVFDLDVCQMGADFKVLSASKDGSVALSVMTESCLLHNCSFAAHSDVVKSVQWMPHNNTIFATASNDHTMKVFDCRDASHKAQVTLSLHRLTVCSVRWHPIDCHLLASASFDKSIYLCDIRKPQSPLFAYVNHWPSSDSRMSSIIHPAFAHFGSVLLVPAPAAKSIHIISTDSGRCVERIAMDAAVVDLLALDHSQFLCSAGAKLFRVQLC